MLKSTIRNPLKSAMLVTMLKLCRYAKTLPPRSQVRPELLPKHVSPAAAEAVLFVGKAARVLQGAGSGAGAISSGLDHASAGSPAQGLPARLPARFLATSTGGGSAHWRPEVEGLGTAQRLQALAAQPQLDLLAFQSAVEASRKQVAFFKSLLLDPATMSPCQLQSGPHCKAPADQRGALQY